MKNQPIKLVTIFTEAAIESAIMNDLDRLGASGYTITNARGSGSHGLRGASWQPNSNIRIEVLCDSDIASQITEYMQKTYYDNYAMVVFTAEVDVLRPEKFTKSD